MLKIRKTNFKKIFLISTLLIISGCSAEKKAMPAEVTKASQTVLLNSVSTFDQLSLLDDTLLKNQIQEMNSSDEDILAEDPENTNNKIDRILIVGDSWAVFPCLFGSMKKMIRHQNINLVNDSRCLKTSKLGIKADEWVGSRQDRRTLKMLKNSPQIKYIYLSLGGNDMMGNWTKDYTTADEIALFEKTSKTIQKIMTNYLNIRSDLKIILSGYDFPHFKTKHTLGLYKTIYDRMGRPSDLRINDTLVRFMQHLSKVENKKNIFFINHIGIAQYYDGVPEDSFPQKSTLHPDLISSFNDSASVGGEVNLHSSDDSMINWFYLANDAFHLSQKNYLNVMNHTYRNILSNIITN